VNQGLHAAPWPIHWLCAAAGAVAYRMQMICSCQCHRGVVSQGQSLSEPVGDSSCCTGAECGKVHVADCGPQCGTAALVLA